MKLKFTPNTFQLFFYSALMFNTIPAHAELYFNVNALHLSEEQKEQMDLSMLSRVDVQVPGEYTVQINVNQSRIGEDKLNFVVCDTKLCPEMTPTLLKEWGVKVSALPELSALEPNTVITQLDEYIPQSEITFDFGKRVLNISIPQAALDNTARGYISPDQWDDGVPALFTSYSASGSEVNNRLGDNHTSTQYLNLRSGVNLGAWRLRNYSYYTRTNTGENSWNSMQTWLERDVKSLNSRLVAGETTSPGLVFDSFSFSGAYLASQDDMLPNSQQGYAPEIRGVALTNATVEVRQNGNLLYQTFVPPGEFVINDLYATSTSGNLDITVKEQDGTERTYVQAYASPPISVRKDMLKYSATIGKYGTHSNSDESSERQQFIQAEFLYGLFNNTSIYGGLTASDHYRSAAFGVGQSLGDFGAISFDVTQANTEFEQGEQTSGQSYRLRYSKRLETTGTTITVAGYRYATNGYYNFDEANNWYSNTSVARRSAIKNSAQISLNQNLGELGSVSLSAYQQEYWDQDNTKSRSFFGSWSKSFNGTSISLNQSQTKSWRTGKTDNVTSLNVSFPLGRWLSNSDFNSMRVSSNYSTSNQDYSSFNSTLSGTALEGHNLSYSLAQSWNRQTDGNTNNSTALSTTYNGGLVTASLGYSNYYGQNSQINWGVRGSVVAHPYGVTLSQPLSEGSAYAIIRAPGADGVRVQNQRGLVTDWRGYAIVPSMVAYRENELRLDTNSLSDDVDLVSSMQRAVPTREAFVLADYNTRIGQRVFLTLSYQGHPLPLGTTVETDNVSGITDENGQVYIAGVEDNTTLTASLSDGSVCQIPFDSSNMDKQNGIVMATLECQ